VRAVPVLVLGFAGCSQSLPPRVEPAWTEAVAVPAARARALDVAAAELGVSGPYLAARMAALGLADLHRGGAA